MNRISLTILTFILLLPFASVACEVCNNNQPKILKGITHGTGPQGNIDYIIIWSSVVIVAVTLFLSLKYLISPKENDQNHIKNIILNNN